MPQRDSTTPGHPEGLPPEVHNDEQDPTGTQAQDVAEDARGEDSRTASPLESTKPRSNDNDPAPDSAPDLIDEIRRMEGEGRIDMSAYAGEPNHDDEPGIYGGETTDDDDADWLTADGEELGEADDDLLTGEDEGEVEIPEDDTPNEIEPLPDDDATPPQTPAPSAGEVEDAGRG